MPNKLVVIATLFTSTFAACCMTVAQDTNSRFHFSSKSSSIDLTNTPLASALGILADMTEETILIDSKAIDAAHVSLSHPVTISTTDVQLRNILDEILPNGLIAIKREKDWVVTSRDVSLRSSVEELSSAMNSARDLRIAKALERSVPMHFDRVPMEMVLNMIGGFTGQWISIPMSVRREANIDRFEWVTLHEDHATLGECLQSVLQVYNLEYKIEDGEIVVVVSKGADS